MKAIRLDFAPPSLARALRQISPMAWFVMLAGMVACLGAAVSIAELTQQQAQLRLEDQQLALQLDARKAPLPVSKALSITEPQAKSLNGAIAQLNLPWRDLLDAVETATPDSVALLSLEPDGRKHLLKGMAETKTADDMLGYVQALKRETFFKAVVLTRHAVNDQDPNRPIRFQFEAQWKAGEP